MDSLALSIGPQERSSKSVQTRRIPFYRLQAMRLRRSGKSHARWGLPVALARLEEPEMASEMPVSVFVHQAAGDLQWPSPEWSQIVASRTCVTNQRPRLVCKPKRTVIDCLAVNFGKSRPSQRYFAASRAARRAQVKFC